MFTEARTGRKKEGKHKEMSYIEFQDINKYFGQNHVLKGIDLSIEKGELLTLLVS